MEHLLVTSAINHCTLHVDKHSFLSILINRQKESAIYPKKESAYENKENVSTIYGNCNSDFIVRRYG